MFVFLEFCSCPICKLFLVIFVRHFSQSSKNLSVEAQNLSSKKELLGQKLKILLSSYLQIRERPLHINKNIFTCFKFNAVCGNFPVAILTDCVTQPGIWGEFSSKETNDNKHGGQQTGIIVFEKFT